MITTEHDDNEFSPCDGSTGKDFLPDAGKSQRNISRS